MKTRTINPKVRQRLPNIPTMPEMLKHWDNINLELLIKITKLKYKH